MSNRDTLDRPSRFGLDAGGGSRYSGEWLQQLLEQFYDDSIERYGIESDQSRALGRVLTERIARRQRMSGLSA